MRRSGISLLLFGFAFLGFASFAWPLHASDLSYARIVRVSLVSGDVQVTRPGHSNWEPAAANMPLMQGMTLGTNDGRAEVQFEDGSTAWIAENTLVQFTELALSDGGRITKLTLAQGTISIYATLKSADSFTVSLPQGEIVVPKSSLFRVDAFHDGASISVLQGNLQVSSSAGAQTLVKGQTLAFKANVSGAAVTPNPKSDTWDRWVNAREQTLLTETASSLSYANAPFTYGLADLSYYGGWNYFAGYGYGWQPFGMAAGWAPFSMGGWASYPGLGWTWISAEPWGWVPYHFGDWIFSPVYGWMWFPDNFGFWNPAPVNWYSYGNQVAWAPASRVGPKMPTAPRILVVSDSKSIGKTGSVRIVTAVGESHSVQMLPGGPLENGRAPRLGDHNAPAQSSRAFVPTAPSMAHLQKSLLASGNVPAMKMNSRLPSSPAIQAMRFENAMRMPAALPHRPAPMYNPRISAPMEAGARSGGFGAPAYSGPAFSGSASSAGRMSVGAAPARVSSAPASHPSGRPN